MFTISAAHEPAPRSCARHMEHYTLAETYGDRWDEKVPLVYQALLNANGSAYFETCPNFKVGLGLPNRSSTGPASFAHQPPTLRHGDSQTSATDHDHFRLGSGTSCWTRFSLTAKST